MKKYIMLIALLIVCAMTASAQSAYERELDNARWQAGQRANARLQAIENEAWPAAHRGYYGYYAAPRTYYYAPVVVSAPVLPPPVVVPVRPSRTLSTVSAVVGTVAGVAIVADAISSTRTAKYEAKKAEAEARKAEAEARKAEAEAKAKAGMNSISY